MRLPGRAVARKDTERLGIGKWVVKTIILCVTLLAFLESILDRDPRRIFVGNDNVDPLREELDRN